MGLGKPPGFARGYYQGLAGGLAHGTRREACLDPWAIGFSVDGLTSRAEGVPVASDLAALPMMLRALRFLVPVWLMLVFVARSSAAELLDEINVSQLDQHLLARAIFEETNRVRVEAGLKHFLSESKLGDAADTQAKMGSLFRPPSHTNPFPLISTPTDRVKFAGLEPGHVAENIALLSIYEVPSGMTLYYTKDDSILRDSRDGRPVRPHTYRSFARAVVAAWMASPGHRANILDRRLRYLGCAVRASRSQDGIDMVFAVQAFYTPKRGAGG